MSDLNVTSTVHHVGAHPPAAGSVPGHNTDNGTPSVPKENLSAENALKHNAAKGQLKSIVDRIEQMNEEIKALTSDRGDIYTEAKGNGFDVKALRTVVRLRAMDAQKRAEQDAVLDVYMLALGMI
jgi:uncharacterized protein (UPF0335 family)